MSLAKITATCEQCKGAGCFTERTELTAHVGVADTAGKFHGTPGNVIHIR